MEQFTTADKAHLDKLWSLHTWGVPVFLAVLGGGFLWWRSKRAGPTFR